ncbi:uncharacterized protein [Epargyreus clarus]|uniref:uncharacterized protein n=1 Tax=Epargyreus clarus TaxID=520877 RepID=UPI003C2D2BC7
MLKYMDGEVDRKCGVHTGIHATFSKGDYFSVEGVPLSRMITNWADNKPDDFNDHESCIVMLHDGTLADVNCNDTFPYICYWKSEAMLCSGLKGTPLAQSGYSQFSPGEPNNYKNKEFCGAIRRNGMFVDVDCESIYAFICEKSPDSLKCIKKH